MRLENEERDADRLVRRLANQEVISRMVLWRQVIPDRSFAQGAIIANLRELFETNEEIELELAQEAGCTMAELLEHPHPAVRLEALELLHDVWFDRPVPAPVIHIIGQINKESQSDL
jgi:hypothetical protein